MMEVRCSMQEGWHEQRPYGRREQGTDIQSEMRGESGHWGGPCSPP